jgi:endoglucanase
MNTRFFRHHAAWILLAMLSACNGDSSSSGSTPAATSNELPTTTQPQVTPSPPVTAPPVTSPPVTPPPVTTPPVPTPPVTTPPVATTMASLSLSATSYTATSSSVQISVKRTTSSAGAASVNYATSNGTASAGTDYTAASGIITWSDGDSAAKTITIKVNGTASSTPKTFKIALTGVTGHAAVGTPSSATVILAAAAPSTGSLALFAATYSVPSGSASLTVSVARSGGSAGAATVKYATTNGTAVSGTDYTSTTGTLTWSAADAAAKTFSIPLITAGNGGKNFTVTLSSATGAALGSPVVATVSLAAKSTSSTALAIKVKGNTFVDQNGKTFQMRGVNVSGLESVAIQGWSVSDPWGGMKPDWSALQAWKVNSVRLPLNEASWLGYTCVDSNGATLDPDPGKNYRATVAQTVTEANAAGLYVILDLHWSAPGTICPTDQNWMADTDHSIAFWTSIADTFKANPAVIFELYNEPVLTDSTAGWNVWLNGGAQTTVRPGGGKTYAWTSAGMQQLLEAVRATGATNVVLCGGVSYSNVLTSFPSHIPVDPISQLGAAWHVYSFNIYVDPSPGTSTTNMLAAVSANVPLAITEVGDTDGAGATGSFVKKILTFADSTGYSYFGWTWNDWGQSSNDLILDSSGTPTIGFGTYFKQHLICRATTTTSCP